MPWPVYGKMTDNDLKAIYEFLRAIPSRPDNRIRVHKSVRRRGAEGDAPRLLEHVAIATSASDVSVFIGLLHDTATATTGSSVTTSAPFA